MTQVLSDFKAGPLDFYRAKSSFDWKKLKIFFDSEEAVRYEYELYEELQKHQDYQMDNCLSLSFDEERRIATRQMFAYKSIEKLSLGYLFQNLQRPVVATRVMMQYAPSSTIKRNVTELLFLTTLRNMGSERHQHLVNDAEENKILGCYCLTEIGHGSNAKGMRTLATYNKEKKVFVLHSENFEAAKCWAGGLGQCCTHAVVYAQLMVDGVKYGLHNFVVPIRDPKTLLPYPGLIIGDMGEKVGLNGIDNGFIMFDNYEIPRENLLNKLGDVTENGEYITPYRDPNKRHGAILGTLSGARVDISTVCETQGIKALIIAIRYAAVRRQFGPEDGNELPILEYQTHQYRLLPYLAAAYVLRNFNTFMEKEFYQFATDSIFGNNKENLPEIGIEIHGICCASKPMAGWIMKDAIQECREACGGHGYLKVAGIGDIRNAHDANLTYEGENHVLIQQNSNWLLKMWPLVMERKKIDTPMKSVSFLTNGLDILMNSKFNARSIEEICDPKNIITVYQWLVCYLLNKTHDRFEKNLRSGKPVFWAKNDSQVFCAKDLSIAFIQHFYLQKMLNTISEADDLSIKAVLTRLFSLYGLWSLEKHIPTLYQGEFAQGSKLTSLIQDAILKLCTELKDDAVALVDVVAPPDFILNSVLGASDGEVYKHLQSAIFRSPYAMSRPSWWQDITNLQENFTKSKL